MCSTQQLMLWGVVLPDRNNLQRLWSIRLRWLLISRIMLKGPLWALLDHLNTVTRANVSYTAGKCTISCERLRVVQPMTYHTVFVGKVVEFWTDMLPNKSRAVFGICRHDFMKVASIAYLYRTMPSWNIDVIAWNRLPHRWPFVRGIYRSPMDSPKTGTVVPGLIFLCC